MVEITMDFNEQQRRINDMNNPDFWLQKAIQKQKVNSVIAMEGAIDYYKQGLRIVLILLLTIYRIHKVRNSYTTLLACTRRLGNMKMQSDGSITYWKCSLNMQTLNMVLLSAILR